MTDLWTREHDVALVDAYLGYEVQRCFDSIVCIIDGHTVPLPDMRDRHHGWALDCLDSWVSVAEGRSVHTEALWPSRRRRVWLYTHNETSAYAEGRTLNEAVAWALWHVREM